MAVAGDFGAALVGPRVGEVGLVLAFLASGGEVAVVETDSDPPPPPPVADAVVSDSAELRFWAAVVLLLETEVVGLTIFTR